MTSPSQSKRVSVVVSAPVGGDAATKNTRRRIQQKRTRNKNGGAGGGGGGHLKKPEDKPNPVIESSNPFFIAVCSPESYKPKMGGNGSGGGRRLNEPPVHAAPIRTKPNVFLRQPSRHLSYDSGTGTGSGSNQFIHHPRLQNERQRGDSTASVIGVVSSTFRNDTIPNIRDTEQFPSLSSTSAVLNTTRLNFKEMVMKNTNTVSQSDSVPEKPLTVEVLPPQKYQKLLSSGNIFSSVFYGGNDRCDDVETHSGEGEGEGGGGGGGGGGLSISSVLVDSCDRKYDNLYKY
jgi:hypothetical protein